MPERRLFGGKRRRFFWALRWLYGKWKHALYPECDGSFACPATVHLHGCFADAGNCDEPGEHRG